MERLAKLVVGGLLALSLLGCYGRGYGRDVGEGPIATGIIAGAAIGALAVAASEPPPPEPVYYSSTTYYVQTAPASAPAPAPRVDDQLPSFDPIAARAALAAVDVTACGGPTGYGHARVTMNPDGKISRVQVEDPSNLEPAVADCVGRELGRATVAPFRGSLVVVGTSFRLK